MKPAMWTAFFYDKSPEDTLRLLSERDWRYAELSSEDSFVLLDRGDPDRTGAEFRSVAEGLGVSVLQGHLWLICDIACEEQQFVVDQLKRWLDLYLAIGIQAAVLHPGGTELRQKKAEPKRILDTQARALRELCAHVKGADLWVCLENMADQQANDLLKIIDATECGNLGICLDTGHLNLIPGDQGLFIRTAGRLLKATHIADNDTSHDQHLMPYARGTVDWVEVVGALKEIRYDGLFNFEIPGENRCPLAVRQAKLDYLKAIMPVLLREREGD